MSQGNYDDRDEPSEDQLIILRDRAIALAKLPNKEYDQKNLREMVTCKIGSQIYGFDSKLIQKIVDLESITKIPTLPKFVLGVTNLRGEILVVIDLHGFFGMENIKEKANNLVIIGKNQAEFGITVQGTDKIMKIPNSAIKKMESENISGTSNSEISQYVEGVIDEEIVVLNLAKIINDKKLYF